MAMSAEHLVMRMLASLGRIEPQRVRINRLGPDERSRLSSQAALLNDTNLFIVDQRALTPSELRACYRRLHKAHGLGLVVVDTLQLLHVPGIRNTRHRDQHYAETGRIPDHAATGHHPRASADFSNHARRAACASERSAAAVSR